MMNRKRFFSATLTIASILTLAACGGANSSTSDSTGADGEEGKTLTFMFRGGEDEKKAYETDKV